MDKILNLFTQPLACTEDYYRAMRLALFSAMRNGTLAEFESETGKNLPKCEIAVTNSETLAIQIAEDYELTNPNLPENSIAVITVEGGIYPYISYRIEQLVKAANANPNINGILFFVNTPGFQFLMVQLKEITIFCRKLARKFQFLMVQLKVVQ